MKTLRYHPDLSQDLLQDLLTANNFTPDPDVIGQEPLPSTWEKELEQFCIDCNNKLVSPLKKHIGAEATYTLKSVLITQLQLIYRYLKVKTSFLIYHF